MNIKMDYKAWHIALCVAAGFALAPVQDAVAFDDVSFEKALDSSYEDVYMPYVQGREVVIDDDTTPPVRPYIEEITFQTPPPLSGLKERVDRIAMGITIDVAPQFDHYGHEIRRYMAHVGAPEIFTDRAVLLEQAQMVEKASIVADFWKKALLEEIYAIEAILEQDAMVAPNIRTTFNQNRAAAQRFLFQLDMWLRGNENLLQFMKDDLKEYTFVYPRVEIFSGRIRNDFYNLVRLRQSHLREMMAYRPFAMMVY